MKILCLYTSKSTNKNAFNFSIVELDLKST